MSHYIYLEKDGSVKLEEVKMDDEDDDDISLEPFIINPEKFPGAAKHHHHSKSTRRHRTDGSEARVIVVGHDTMSKHNKETQKKNNCRQEDMPVTKKRRFIETSRSNYKNPFDSKSVTTSSSVSSLLASEKNTHKMASTNYSNSDGNNIEQELKLSGSSSADEEDDNYDGVNGMIRVLKDQFKERKKPNVPKENSNREGSVFEKMTKEEQDDVGFINHQVQRRENGEEPVDKGEKEKSKYFKRYEDVLLSKAFVSVATDPAYEGVNQKSDKFWFCVVAAYNQLQKQLPFDMRFSRSMDTLRMRWRRFIFKEVQLYNKIYIDVKKSKHGELPSFRSKQGKRQKHYG